MAEATVEEEIVKYKAKVVQFLGRGIPERQRPLPSPRNLFASFETGPVYKSWFGVISWWTDSFCSCMPNKDDGHVNNRQQNISKAMDLLPRLAAGIDVNVHFRK
ncbi:hypothetical protein BHE74_00057904 [Ensete ventricosum]|nr:hypothetical protein GW17_00040662 [Ensete ventricosum]RWW37032.1 hypothetical protein BHE74_00057904 [Ensete ventricosum]RZR94062.1 hypothetical protein BHM03_00022679 [Ensete ventricosum]